MPRVALCSAVMRRATNLAVACSGLVGGGLVLHSDDRDAQPQLARAPKT
jgi:hypothetical protein